MPSFALTTFAGGASQGIRVTTRFLGLKELERAMAEAGRRIRADLRARLKEAGRIVQADAKGRATSKRVRRALTLTVRVPTPADFEAEVGTLRRRAFFAHFLERGTKAGPAHPFTTRAFPFLAPAVEATEERVFRILGQVFEVV